MTGRRDLFKEIKGQSFAEWKRVNRLPKANESLDLLYKRKHSRHPLRLLGYGTETDVWITEEERTHIHVIGTTRVGKSKFLEKMIRDDIDRGNGLCLIDSSDNGQTAKDIVRYCASRNHQKVLVIDPLQYLLFKKVLPINLMQGYPDEAAERIRDIILIQFQQKDFSETPVIKQYLPAIVRTLHRARLSFADARYFINPAYGEEREAIFRKVGRNDDTLLLQYVFNNRELYREYRPTARRILDVFNQTIEPIFASTEGVDFRELIKDKWVVLVNLYPKKSFGVDQARFLGTAIINEFTRAIDDLVGADWIENDSWAGRYYLYVDEGGRYANQNIANLLSYKGKTGLQLIFAHHYLRQVKDPDIRDAILNQTDIQVVFRLKNPGDAELIANMVYGGQVKDRDGSFYFKNLRKRECVVKIPGQEPKTILIEEIIYDKSVDARNYLEQIYANSLYRSTNDILSEQGNRLNIQSSSYEDRRNNPISPKQASKAHSGATGKGGVRKQENAFSIWADSTQQFKQRQKASGSDGEGQAT